MAKIYLGEKKEAVVCPQGEKSVQNMNISAGHFKEASKEGQEKEICLQKLDTDAFLPLADWVYGSGKFFK